MRPRTSGYLIVIIVLVSGVPLLSAGSVTSVPMQLGYTASLGNVTNSTNLSNPQLNEIQAYAVGNIGSTQVPGYTYYGITSPMPDQIIINVTSPGNSSFSATFNGLVLNNASGPVQHITFSYNTAVGCGLPQQVGYLNISVSCLELHATKVFSYHLNVMSAQNFINYENIVTHSQLVIMFNGGDVFLFLFVLAVAISSSLFFGLWSIPLMRRNRDPSKYLK